MFCVTITLTWSSTFLLNIGGISHIYNYRLFHILLDTLVYGFNRTTFLGFLLILLLVFGFAAAVIGGLESMVGAVAGGLVLGLGVTFVSNYVSTSLTFPTAFVFLIIILLVRPSGIVSGKRSRRA